MKEIGIYIHIPFCIRKCYYCDFCSAEMKGNEAEEYVGALVKEIARWKEQMIDYRVKSVFIGGGTPTLLPLKDMDRLLNALYGNFKMIDQFEFTIESNPGTLTAEKIKYYLGSGINRLSIGLQAWQNHLLQSLGRIHSAQEFEKNYFSAKELGFENINVDLMFGLPNQTNDDWDETLKKTIALKPEHISTYSLKVEEGTLFGRLLEEGKIKLNDENDRSMYHGAIEYLKLRGYSHYEISNFAIKGKDCIHNKIYWNNEEYIGIGLAAHSYLNNTRFSNEVSLSTYMQKINNDLNPKVFEYVNSVKDEIEEAMFLGLRMIEGIHIKKFTTRFGKSPMEIYPSQLNSLKNQGLLILGETHIRLTSKGIDLSNHVFSEFLMD